MKVIFNPQRGETNEIAEFKLLPTLQGGDVKVKSVNRLQRRLNKKYAKKTNTEIRQKRFFKAENKILNSIRKERLKTIRGHIG